MTHVAFVSIYILEFSQVIKLLFCLQFLNSKLYLNAVNPLKPELNPICYLLALLAHHFLHVSRIRVKSLTFRRLMSYIYDISRLRVKYIEIIIKCN